jgi:CheY-like chemotaxis protein/predicted DNA-binding protein
MSLRDLIHSPLTVANKPAKKKPGRPPAGQRPGERVSDYPRFALRLPEATYEVIQALAEASGTPQWRVISDAVDAYIASLPEDQRALVRELLNRAQPLLMQPVRTPPARTPVAPVTVLNVDDNDSMRFARTAILRDDGFNVVEAGTGQEALRALEQCGARIVVLDVNLPDMSGLDVCRQIKSDDRWSHVRVVQTSATFSTPHDQLHGLESGGADIYLAEPVSRGTLLSIVRRLADMTQA